MEKDFEKMMNGIMNSDPQFVKQVVEQAKKLKPYEDRFKEIENLLDTSELPPENKKILLLEQNQIRNRIKEIGEESREVLSKKDVKEDIDVYPYHEG